MDSNIIYYQTVEKIISNMTVLGFMAITMWVGLKAFRMYLSHKEQLAHINQHQNTVNYEALIDGVKKDLQLFKNKMTRGKK